MKKVASIIVNWNGREWLQNCFQALEDQSYEHLEIVLVDNGSHDDSIAFTRENFPDIHIIELEENLGFAGGNNAGISYAFDTLQAEYIHCINNDTIADKHCVRELVAHIDTGRNIHITCSQASFPDGNIQCAGLVLTNIFQLHKNGSLSRGYDEDPAGHQESKLIPCLGGVCFLATRESLEHVGLFDESYGSYMEDVDLGFRMSLFGYKTCYVPSSKLTHFHSKTSGGVGSPMKVFHIRRNAIYTAIKCLSFVDMMLFPFRDFIWSVQAMRNTKQVKTFNKAKSKNSKGSLLYMQIKAYVHVFFALPSLIKKRIYIQKNRVLSKQQYSELLDYETYL